MNTNGSSSAYSPRQNHRGSGKQQQQQQQQTHEDRSSRYQSNPSKFISNKSKGSIAVNHQRGLTHKNGSQGSLRHSESRGSLAMRSDD